MNSAIKTAIFYILVFMIVIHQDLTGKDQLKKLAQIYIMVEEYRAKNTKSSILQATKEVAKELGEKETLCT